MNSVAGFYGSLFTVEFTILGILFAGIFVFLQIIYQDRLFRFFNKTPWKKLVATGTLSAVSLFITGTGLFLTSFPASGWWTKTFSGSNLAFWIMVLFFVSTVATIWVAIAEILSLQPMSLIDDALKGADMKEMRKFLIKEYGLQGPFLFSIDGALARGRSNKTDKKTQEEIYKKEKVLCGELIASAKDASDPLAGLSELATRAVQQRDIGLFTDVIDAFESVLKKDREMFMKPIPGGKWTPNADLAEHLAEYLLKRVAGWIAEIGVNGPVEFVLKAYGLTEKFAARSIDEKDEKRSTRTLAFWKLEADKWITGDGRVYAHLIELFVDSGNRVFVNQDADFEKSVMDEVFRDLGWLAERLIAQRGIEAKPVMYDTEYKTSYEVLFNALTSFTWAYNNTGARFYPLVFFDAIWVLSHALLAVIDKDVDKGKRQKIYENLFDCAFAYSQFAISAMEIGNGSGASLAAMDLNRFYDDLSEKSRVEEVERLKGDVIGLMIDVAATATGREIKTISAGFMSEGISEYLFKALVKIPNSYSSIFDKEVFEAVLKADRHYDHDALWAYLKRLGQARDSTFGLNL